MTSSILNPRDVIAFVAANSETITNHDLVRHFCCQLKAPTVGDRQLLKGVTKEVRTVTGSGEGGRKTIALKPKFARLSTSEIYSEYLFLIATRDTFKGRGRKPPQPPCHSVHSAASPKASTEGRSWTGCCNFTASFAREKKDFCHARARRGKPVRRKISVLNSKERKLIGKPRTNIN